MQDAPAYRYLTDPQTAQLALAPLTSADVVGLDTETYWDAATNRNTVSLVQIAARSGELLVLDALAVGVEVVRPLVETPAVLMAAHNARFDELVLMSAALQPTSFVDTLRLARAALNLPSYSLAAVVAHLFGCALDKSLQRSNWRRRPLTRAQLAYAALDAHITLRVYDELKLRLEAEQRWAQALQAATLNGAPPREVPRRKLRPKTPPVLTEDERRAVTRLKKWRLERAFAQRVPAYMICSDRTLDELAHTRPVTLEDLQTIYGLGAAKINSLGAELLDAVRAAFA